MRDNDESYESRWIAPEFEQPLCFPAEDAYRSSRLSYLFDCFDNKWNDNPRLTRIMFTGKLVQTRRTKRRETLHTFVDYMFPPETPCFVNPYWLQRVDAAWNMRIVTACILSAFANGQPFRMATPLFSEFASDSENPHYVERPEKLNGVSAVLYEIIAVKTKVLFAQAVDPLLYWEGAEYLRVVRLIREVASEMIGKRLGFSQKKVAVGDRIWVYELGLTPAMERKRNNLAKELEYFSSTQYITTVKLGDCPSTVFQILKFTHAQPHEEMVSRLGRVRTFDGENRSRHVCVEGEMKTGRIEPQIMEQLAHHTSNDVLVVHFRKPPPSFPHFSAPLRDISSRATMERLLTKYELTLMPDMISISDFCTPSPIVIELLEHRDKMKEISDEDGERWKHCIDIMKLGTTGIRLDEKRLMDTAWHYTTLRLINKSRHRCICSFDLPDRDQEQGWSKKRTVIIRRYGVEWSEGTIIKSMLDDRVLTIWLRMYPISMEESIRVEVRIDVEEALTHSEDDLLLGRTLRLDTENSTLGRALQDNYRNILRAKEETGIMSTHGDLDDIPKVWNNISFDREQRDVISVGSRIDVSLLNVDAGAGTGKTTTIAAAIDKTLCAHDGGILIIGTAPTNSAVRVLTNKIDEMGSQATRVTRVFSQLEGEPTDCDLVRQMINCADDEDAPDSLRVRGGYLKCWDDEMKELMKIQRDETMMDEGQFEQYCALENRIDLLRAMCTKALLGYRQPNVLTLTIGTLTRLMQARKSVVKKYINRAGTVIIWLDEASQAPERTLFSFREILPNALVRVVGDPRQLPPFMSTKENTDSRFAGSGVSSALIRAVHTPRLCLRLCRRMHPELLKIPSTLFYSSTLRTSLLPAERSLDPLIYTPNPQYPIYVITAEGHDQRTASGSRFNKIQEQLAVNLVTNTLWPSYQQKAAILSFYREPIERIRRLAPHITASTVDSCQGQEYEVIVILTTRSKEGASRFIEDDPRVNVALTRARRAIFVIGELRVLSDAKHWNRVLQFASSKGNLIYGREIGRKVYREDQPMAIGMQALRRQ